ncbi:MAG: DUF2384 domain-containing protein [Chitinophagia bacterium]|nr:DUF2384 domain-containing protein [Chitinophagia bacterium]
MAVYKEYQPAEEIPSIASEPEVMYYVRHNDINWQYVDAIKSLTHQTDEVIADWLNISVRTLRTYRQPENKFKEHLKEHLVLLLSLMKHGTEVFGDSKAFDNWLDTNNFFFDNEAPKSYLNTITGIRYVDGRLTAMAYGDNV